MSVYVCEISPLFSLGDGEDEDDEEGGGGGCVRGCRCEPSGDDGGGGDDAVRFGGEKPTPSTHTHRLYSR